MKTTGIIIAAVLAVAAIGFGVYMIDVDQTERAELPEISIEGGNAPEYDADVGSVQTGETEITVPTLEVNPPADDDS